VALLGPAFLVWQSAEHHAVGTLASGRVKFGPTAHPASSTAMAAATGDLTLFMG
jgi:hypothetical protein